MESEERQDGASCQFAATYTDIHFSYNSAQTTDYLMYTNDLEHAPLHTSHPCLTFTLEITGITSCLSTCILLKAQNNHKMLH